MSKDFSKYQRLIDEFSGQVLNSEFEARYAVATKKLPKTERFLLKMELKRLASPCTRLVDLRGHVDGECRGFEHENRTSFSIEIFKCNKKRNSRCQNSNMIDKFLQKVYFNINVVSDFVMFDSGSSY